MICVLIVISLFGGVVDIVCIGQCTIYTICVLIVTSLFGGVGDIVCVSQCTIYTICVLIVTSLFGGVGGIVCISWKWLLINHLVTNINKHHNVVHLLEVNHYWTT